MRTLRGRGALTGGKTPPHLLELHPRRHLLGEQRGLDPVEQPLHNRFGDDVLAGRNPFEVTDDKSLDRFLVTVFHRDDVRPPTPWPFDRAYIQRRARDAAFEQRVLDRIGRSPETFLPGDQAGRIRQPTLLLWCRQDAVIDPSALARYAARIPQASRVLLDDCGHMAQMERPDEVAAALNALMSKSGNRE